MTVERATILGLICVIVALLFSGTTMEAVGGALVLGFLLGVMAGAAFRNDERKVEG